MDVLFSLSLVFVHEVKNIQSINKQLLATLYSTFLSLESIFLADYLGIRSRIERFSLACGLTGEFNDVHLIRWVAVK